ncbi:MAG: adenosylhomocysteinase [Thermoproteota archaeon]
MPPKVQALGLAQQGRAKIEWAEERMPVLMELRRRYEAEKPLEGVRIGGCMHITKETAVLVETLAAAGATTAWSGCNPLSTQDDVAAALAAGGVSVFGWRGLTEGEYYWCIRKVIETEPEITLDDGADLVFTLHEASEEQASRVVGGTEETTTGVHRLRAMAKEGKLKYPIIAVNDAETKWDFDNTYGTGQSTVDGILRATNVLLAGESAVVAGYGHCGKGIATRLRGMGAEVTVCEVDPIRALKARMDGFRVEKMEEAAKRGGIFITATGCKDVITGEHMRLMKDGAILCNAGHFNVEVSVSELESLARQKKAVGPNLVQYTIGDGKRLYLIAEGRLVNLAAAEGHPSSVMDMSFANQFLSILYLAEKGTTLKPGVYDVPREQDEEVARIKLESLGISIDRLTEEQRRYLGSWRSGT